MAAEYTPSELMAVAGARIPIGTTSLSEDRTLTILAASPT